MKSIVIYYSLEGNTNHVAKMIAEKIGSDIIKLEPKKEIPKNGFGKFFWGGKSVMFHEKPKLLNQNLNLDDYDTIIIGTPVWAGSFTPPINTFLTKNTLVNKNIFLFVTNAGGSTEKCFSKLKERLEGNQIIGTVELTNVNKMSAQELKEKVYEFCQSISD